MLPYQVIRLSGFGVHPSQGMPLRLSFGLKSERIHSLTAPNSMDAAAEATAEVGYGDLMGGGGATGDPPGTGALTPPPAARGRAPTLTSRSPGTFEDVPLRPRPRGGQRGNSPSAGAYKLKVFTADRMHAGLGSTTVCDGSVGGMGCRTGCWSPASAPLRPLSSYPWDVRGQPVSLCQREFLISPS